MATSVALPARWISAIAARVVALALAVCSDLAARVRCRPDAAGRAKLPAAALGCSKEAARERVPDFAVGTTHLPGGHDGQWNHGQDQGRYQ
jgi:hypothetical protein